MSVSREWIGEARKIPVKRVAAAFKMSLKRGRISPCPACRDVADKRRSDRGPVGVYKGGSRWICNNCKVSGGAVDFAMFRLHGRSLAASEPGFSAVREWFATQGFGGVLAASGDAEGVTLLRPPESELRALLGAATPSGRTRRRDVLRWFDSKGYRPGAVPCFILPTDDSFEYRRLSRVEVDGDDGPRRVLWWNLNKARSFPIAIPAYDEHGTVVNLRGRAITNRRDKQRAATGYDSRLCVMADPWQALRILRGESPNVEVVVIAEGETDFLTFAQECKHDKTIAVFGIFSGATGTLKLVRDAGKWPEKADVVVATDNDKAGRAYAGKVAAALDPIRVRAVPFELFSRRSA